MNIFEILNNFFEEDKTSKLSSSSTKLYFFLIYQVNKSLKAVFKSQVILIDDLGAKTYNWINDKIRVITDEANRNQKSLIISININPKATTPSVTTPRLRQRTSHPPLSRGEFYYINPSKRGIKTNKCTSICLLYTPLLLIIIFT